MGSGLCTDHPNAYGGGSFGGNNFAKGAYGGLGGVRGDFGGTDFNEQFGIPMLRVCHQRLVLNFLIHCSCNMDDHELQEFVYCYGTSCLTANALTFHGMVLSHV